MGRMERMVHGARGGMGVGDAATYAVRPRSTARRALWRMIP
jgi:hypothetical protein